ncbi:ester cyclase [Coleofasciculus sp.]|uniref:ester cyclase n=1 Tax=Coleofasciculus sp. TaxID=3100458 RepID=UPI0039F80559
MATDQEKIDILHRYIETLKSGHLDAIHSLLGDELSNNLRQSPMSHEVHSKEEVAAHGKAGGFDTFTMHDIFCGEDKVVGRYSYTLSSDIVPNAPDGKTTTVTGITIIRIENGKIVEVWNEQDHLGAVLGLEIPLGQG